MAGAFQQWLRLEDWKKGGTVKGQERKFLQLAGRRGSSMGRWGCRGGPANRAAGRVVILRRLDTVLLLRPGTRSVVHSSMLGSWKKAWRIVGALEYRMSE